MANIKSQVKRIKTNKRDTIRNRTEKSKVKTYVKKFLGAIEEKDTAIASASLRDAVKVIDTAAGKGIIHKNSAAGKKSKLYAKLNGLIHAIANPVAEAKAAKSTTARKRVTAKTIAAAAKTTKKAATKTQAEPEAVTAAEPKKAVKAAAPKKTAAAKTKVEPETA